MEITDFVICRVSKVDRQKGFMFAVNGDNRSIMCHIKQGAKHLTVTPEGKFFEDGWISILPDEDEKIAVVRDNNDPGSGRAYTHAKVWVPYRIFEGAKYAMDRMDPIHKIAMRALAVNHRNGSHFTGAQPQVLFEGTIDELKLLAEADLWPLRGIHSTTLSGQGGKTLTLSYNTKWEVRNGNGWVHCGSIVAQTGIIDEKEVRKLTHISN